MAAISYHETVHEVQGIASDSRTPADCRNEFASLEKEAPRPLYAVAEDASGGVIFPMRQAGRRLESLFAGTALPWRPIATPYASSDSLSIALARDLASKASHVVLDRVPEEDGTARQFERAFVKAGWIVARRLCRNDLHGPAVCYRFECWRKSDPRNWPTLTARALRALVSPSHQG